MNRPLRVLHVPAAVGGNPAGLARAERALGLDSVCVVLDPSPFGYAPDRVLREPGVGRLRFELRRASLLWDALQHFDVVHFNFGRTIVPAQLRMVDLPLLRRRGVCIAVTFQGDDARRGDIARSAGGGPSLPSVLPRLYPAQLDAQRSARVARFDRYADLLYYLNPDLARPLPARARFMPYGHVDPREWRPIRSGPNRVPVVVHAPSDREIKGTQYIVAAVEQLRGEGLEIELVLVEGTSHERARALYARADLAVDQLHAGWYGGFAVEMMALGVPVVTYLRDADFGVLPEAMHTALPLINAAPATLTDVLRDWLGPRRHELDSLGRRSREFVQRWHDPQQIAASLVADYAAVRAAKGGRGGRG